MTETYKITYDYGNWIPIGYKGLNTSFHIIVPQCITVLASINNIIQFLINITVITASVYIHKMLTLVGTVHPRDVILVHLG